MDNVSYKLLNKHNKGYKKVTKGPCNFCLEQSTFRVILVDGRNRLACTRCLNSVKYNKRYKPIQHPIIKVTHFTKKDYITRTWYRIKRYFTGDHIYGPFKIKRKK